MEHRFFPSIGADISLLGYGCMRLPTVNGEDAQIDEAAATALLDAAFDGGVNYFDTAYPYHATRAEPFIAKGLVARHPRDSFHLASKLPVWRVKTAEEADALFERQLQRCGVDYFDFYLAHNLSAPHYAMFESYGGYEVLSRKKAEGKIRRLGFSIHDRPAVLEGVLNDHAWDFAQIQLNYLDWELQSAKEQYELLASRSIPVVVMEPVRGGSLATLTEKARAVLQDAAPDRSTASWAIRFAASLPGVMTVLSGMSAPEQVADNLAVMSPFAPLTEAERAALGEALTLYRSAGAIPCTGCRYCMDCPAGVDIPRIFSAYNQFRVDGNQGQFTTSYGYLGPEHQSGRCVSCGACLTKCPQQIDIPARLKEVADAYAAANA